MTWTKSKTDLAISLWNKGWSATEIGASIGKSRNAVLGKINRLAHAGDQRITRLINSDPSRKTIFAQLTEKQKDQNDLYLLQCRDRTFPALPYTYANIERRTGMTGLSYRHKKILEELAESEAVKCERAS